MSATDEVTCPRCDANNRLGSARCWVCYSPLAASAEDAATLPAETIRTAPGSRGSAAKPRPSTLSVVLKIVVVVMGLAALIPVLLIVTCFGLIAFSSFK